MTLNSTSGNSKVTEIYWENKVNSKNCITEDVYCDGYIK
jgi:hypothetical protein